MRVYKVDIKATNIINLLYSQIIEITLPHVEDVQSMNVIEGKAFVSKKMA